MGIKNIDSFELNELADLGEQKTSKITVDKKCPC